MMGPILIGCEYSAVVRDAFRERGHDAWSCDLLETEGDPRWHIKSAWWRLAILHIPCTAMGVCGNRTYGVGKPKHIERVRAIDWSCEVVETALLHSEAVVVENPASVIFPILRERYNAGVQYVQPWQHGHPEQKKTGLALWGVPRLTPTNDVYDHMMTLPRSERERVFFMSPGEGRGKERARFYPGIAEAMAEQWGAQAERLAA